MWYPAGWTRWFSWALLICLGLAGCGDDPTPLPGRCDLQLTKEAVDDGTFGGPITYTLVVDNMGDRDCQTPLVVTDSLPPGITYTSSPSSNWNCSVTTSNPDEVECIYNGSPLAAQTSLLLELEVDVTAEACQASNCAEVSNSSARPSKKTRIDTSPENNRDCADTQCNSAQNCIDPPSGMVGWWTGDQTLDDRSGQGNHGTLQNGAYYSTGQVLEAFKFDGDDDHVEIPDDATLNFGAADQFSIDAWIYPTDDGDAVDTILDKRAVITGREPTGYALQLRDGVLLVFTQNADAGVTHSISNAAPDNEWTHVTVTVDLDADQGIVYLNGTQDSTFQPSSTGAGSLTNSAPLFIGQAYSGSERFGGRIDEVEIFSRLLDATEVAGLFEAGPCGKCRIPCVDGKETLEGGESDNFQGGTDANAPSPFLQTFFPTKTFDDPMRNRHFIHTFSDLKPTAGHRFICNAELEIRMRPSGTKDSNDTLQLTFSDGNGNQVGAHWSIHIGDNSVGGNWTNSLYAGPWSQNQGTGVQTFTLDLANLPPSGTHPTNLMPDLDAFEMLNIRVQDDTEVDYANLTVHYSCEACDFPSPETDLELSKTLDSDLVVGQTSQYVISIQNVSSTEARPTTTVTDTVPDCLDIVGVAAPWDQWCTVTGQTVSCQYPDPIISGGQTDDLVIEVQPTEACGDQVENCATVQTEMPSDADTSNNTDCATAEVRRPRADLSVDKVLNGTLQLGMDADYRITVTNNGPDTHPAPVTVTDELPSCMQYVGHAPPTWNCSTSGQMVTCDFQGPLAPSQSETLSLTVRLGDGCGDLVRNCARVQSTYDSVPTNDESCDTSPVQ